MPYCTNCGTEVGNTDKFCAKCGLAQKPDPAASSFNASGAPPPVSDLLNNVTPRTASILCYVPWMGWIASVVILASPRFQKDRNVRFHAFQGLYLFVVWLLVKMVIDPILHYSDVRALHAVGGLLHIVVFIAWIFMMIKTSHNESYSLPVIGELADRSVAEQRTF
ncbi:MAG: zinc-ribbon domain-containing protein [Bryobacteraceae bacterium]|nr:zinc-ribbon domain-containing protein [Bryobacteraceae bacterium]